MAKSIGLSTLELDDIDVGQIMDLIVAYVEANDKQSNNGKARKATQADFDAF